MEKAVAWIKTNPVGAVLLVLATSFLLYSMISYANSGDDSLGTPPIASAPTPPSASNPVTVEGRAAQRIGGSLDVSRADFGDRWPFTVEDGLLTCQKYSGGALQAVVFGLDDVAYAVNGTAKSLTDTIGNWEEDISPIWADDPEIPGAKKNLGPVIDVGLILCPKG